MKKLNYDKVLTLGFSWILLVSLIDHYLTIKFQSNVINSERNPLGRLLIYIDGNSVALFMTAKMAFLWVIAVILLKLFQFKKHYAYAGLATLSIVQLLLVLYLLS